MKIKKEVQKLYHLVSIIRYSQSYIPLAILRKDLAELIPKILNETTDIVQFSATIGQLKLAKNVISELDFILSSICYNSILAEEQKLLHFYEFSTKNNRLNESNKYFIQEFENLIHSNKEKSIHLYLLRNEIKLFNSFSYGLSQDLYFHKDLLCFFVIRSLNVIIHYCSINVLYKINFEHIQNELDRISALIRSYEIKEPEIYILEKTALLATNNNKNTFIEIRNCLNTTKYNLSIGQIYSIYSIIINSLYIHLKEWEYSIQEVLDVYKELFNNYPQAIQEFTTPQLLKNIATLCIRCNEINWFYKIFSKSVIQKFGIDIQSTYQFCLAKILFSENKYIECIDFLNKHKTIDIFQDLELRRLQIMCFYELKERVLVDNYLNTFKVFIHRNDTINKMYKESNNNFVRFLNRLNKTVDVKKVEGILTEINTAERVAEKQWLIEKTVELQNKLSEKK